MRNLAKVRNLRLRLEQLEDRLQPSLGLFGDPLAADPLTAQVDDTTSELQLVTDAAESQDVAGVAQSISTVQQAPAQAPQAVGQAASPTAALQVILNANGGTIQSGKRDVTMQAQAVTQAASYNTVLGTPSSPLVPVDVSNFTVTRTVCGDETGTQDFVWSQYRGGPDIEANFRVDATDAGVVYSAGLGTDPVAGDNPGTVTMRSGATCTTLAIGTPESNFLILYGVNVAAAGGSVYTAGFDVFSGTAYIFKLDAALTTIEAGVQSASAVSLNFFFDIVNDAAGNRYIVGMTQNAAQQDANSVRLTKLDANLTVPIVAPYYDVVITFLDAPPPGGQPLQSYGLSLDVNAAGVVYAGGGIVTAPNDIENVTMRLNAAGTALDWNGVLGFPPTFPPSGPNGGMYGVKVQGPAVFVTGIIADPVDITEDLLLVARWADSPTATLVGGAGWGAVDPGFDYAGYGITSGTDLMPIVVGTITGPEGDTDGVIFKFGVAMNTIVGEDYVANPTLDPNKDDELYGITLIGTGATPDFAISGDTTSNDLTPILNACTGEDTFGGILDGYMARYAQPLP